MRKCISIIIPVFNGEKYIRQCLDSVLSQTLKELEIICIDDGSSDDSKKIIGEYMKRNRNIFLINHPDNQGPGPARNAGIKRARGEYIAFLDADDFYLDIDALEKMYFLCKSNHTLVCGSYRMNLDCGKKKRTRIIKDDSEIAEKRKIAVYSDYQFDYEYQNFIFNRQMILDSDILFPAYRRFQDPPFLVKALHQAKVFSVADTFLYCYRVSNIVFKLSQSKIRDLLDGLTENLLFAQKHKLDILFQNTVGRIEYEYCSIICHNISNDDTSILERLLNINRIISGDNNADISLIRPLKMLLNNSMSYYAEYECILNKLIEKCSSIAVYGAGKIAAAFLNYLDQKNQIKKIRTVLVTKAGIEKSLGGIPIIPIDEVQSLDGGIIFIATGAIYHKEICELLNNKGFYDYEIVDDVFLHQLAGEWL